MRHILVIDVGTSSMRGVLYNGDGEILDMFQCRYNILYLSEIHVEQESVEWKRILYSILSHCAEYISEHKISIDAISLTSQRSSIIPVTKEGEPLYRTIMWQDKRNADVCNALKVHEQKIVETTGARINTVFSGGKMSWLRKNEPDIYNRAYKILTIADYLAFLITGEFKTDHTYGSRSSLMNVRTRQWDDEMLRLFEIDREKLCELCPPGSVLGYSTESLKEQTGFPAGVPYISAGGDQQCAALGIGVVAKGDVELTTGTGAFLLAYTDSVPEKLQSDVICGAHAIPGKYVLETSMLVCASLYDWFRKQFYREVENDKDAYALIDQEVASSANGTNGCIVLPYFQGRGSPDWNSKATGSFFNITLNTTRADMARAVMESIAMEAANNIEVLEQYIATTDSLYVSGGLTASDEFNKIQANSYNKNILKCDNAEQTSLGAWASAVVTLKIFDSYENALKKAKQKEDVIKFLPQNADVDIYKVKRQEMNRLYKLLYS